MSTPDEPAGLTADEWAKVRRAVRVRAEVLARALPADAPHTADDLEAEGLLGALAALPRFDRGQHCQPDTFLVPRAVGAMRDAVRAFNRVVRVPRKEFGGRTRRTLTASTIWHDPNWWESAIPDAWLAAWFAEPAVGPPDPADGPRYEFRAGLRRAFGRLPAGEEDALVAYFFDGRTMDDLAAHEGVCPSRVSQRIRHALRELRGRGVDRQTAGACLAGHRRER